MSLFFILHSSTTQAAPAFNAGNIISDAKFTNYNSMDTAQIQQFLNQKNSVCLKDTNKKYQSLVDDNGDGVVADGGSESYGRHSPMTAAQLINAAAKIYKINPQVILATLQKEQGLITRSDCPAWRYNTALGYGCPDSAPCDNSAFGFTRQIDYGTYHFRGYFNDSLTFVPFSTGNHRIYYNPNQSCGSSIVNIQNRATASLYSYTPYQPNAAALAAGYGEAPCGAYGNRNFFLFFNDWFGSTYFPQPAGAQLYRQSSNGKIYLIANNKRFYIPSPSVMSNYNLSQYGTVSASDSNIAAIEDGGTLSNIIISGGNVYLINNGNKHHITAPSVCDNWELECFNTNYVKSLGSDFSNSHLKTGSSINNTFGNNGAYYEMSSGTKHPFANAASFTASGYSTSAATAINNMNANYPLGELRIKTPGIIKFSPKPDIYYFNGSQYYKVTGMSIYNAWGLGGVTAISAPKSSYNTTADPSSTPLSLWASSSSGAKYVISEGGEKIALSPAQQDLWPDSTYITGVDNLLSRLPTKNLGSFIKVGINYFKLDPITNRKLYIASMADYIELGGKSSNTTRLSPTLANSIESGPFAFADGRLIKVQGDADIYVMNQSRLSRVSSMSVLNSYRLNTSNMKTYPQAAIDEYEAGGTLRYGKLPDGSAVIPYNNKLLVLAANKTTEYGLDQTNFIDISQALVNRASKVSFTAFLRDSTTGRMYHASNGGLNYISSMAEFNQLGGNSSPLTSVDTAIINLFEIHNPV